jgi:hypothetical protein
VTTQKTVFRSERGLFNRDRVFKIRLKVATVSKGSEVKPGEEITIVAWKAHRRLPWHAGPQGHGSIPKKGDAVTLYLSPQGNAQGKEGTVFRPLLPNGIVVQKKTD